MDNKLTGEHLGCQPDAGDGTRNSLCAGARAAPEQRDHHGERRRPWVHRIWGHVCLMRVGGPAGTAWTTS